MLEQKWSNDPPVAASPSSPTDEFPRRRRRGKRQTSARGFSSYILAELVINTFFKKGSHGETCLCSCYFLYVQTLLILQVLRIKFYMNSYIFGGVCSFLF